MARYMRSDLGTGHTFLRPPTVVNQPPEPFKASPVDVYLTAVATKADNLVRRAPYSKLRPPVVIGAGIAFSGPMVWLREPRNNGERRQRRGFSHLGPPTVVFPVDRFFGPRVRFTNPRDRRPPATVAQFIDLKVTPPEPPAEVISYGPRVRYATTTRKPGPSSIYGLGGPVVVFTPVVVVEAYYGPAVTLTPSSRGRPKSVLRAPAVVNPYVAPVEIYGPEVTFTRITPPVANPRLSPPAVVRAAPKFSGPYVKLTAPRSSRPPVVSALQPPAVVYDADQFFGPAVKLVPTLDRVPGTVSRLQPPTVVGEFVAEAYYGPQITLARITPPPTTSRLQPPTVVFPFFARPTDVTLTRIVPPPTVARLRPPVVVLTFEARPTEITLVRIRPQPTVTRLHPPVVVFPFFARPTEIALARIRPQPTTTLLRTPTDTKGLEDQGRIRVYLTRIKPQPTVTRLSPPTVVFPFIPRPVKTPLVRIVPPATRYLLQPPVVVYGAVELSGPEITLAPQPKPVTVWFLRPAQVVNERDLVFHPSRFYLVTITPPPTMARLQPPTVVFPFFPRQLPVALVEIRPPVANPRLSPPAVVAPVLAPPIQITLVRIRPPKTLAVLHAPTDTTGLEDQGRVRVTLVRIRPVPTTHRLQPPVVVTPFQVFQAPPIEVWLAPQPKPQTRYELRAPVVVGPVLARAILVSLAPQSRGRPIWFLNPPTAVTQPALSDAFTKVTLATTKPKPTTAFLRPPTVIFPFFARKLRTPFVRIRPQPTVTSLRPPVVVRLAVEIYGPEVTLAPSREPKQVWFLNPPTVVFPFLARPVETTLTRIRPRPTTKTLQPPAAVIVRIYFGPAVHLAPQPKPVTVSRLQPPTVVFLFVARAVTVSLAPSRFPKPSWELRPPTVVTPAFVAAPITVVLTQIRPQPTTTKLNPPQVVNDNERYFGPLVRLTRIRPFPTTKRLNPPTAVIIEICYGQVCGFDFAVEMTGAEYAASVSGTTAPAATVSGGDALTEGCSD